MKEITGGVCAAKGFRAAGVWCGIRKNRSKPDLAMIVSDTRCTAAGVYTKNKVKGAPLTVTQEHLADGYAQAVICNSGNANTCAPNGMEIANETCRLTAQALGLEATDVIVGSTGVIGQEMSIEPFRSGIPPLASALRYDGSTEAARAIMTTDQKVKEAAVEFTIDGRTCRLGAIAKGSGMIHPNMATMLCFITTDVAISAEMLQKALRDDVADSFNQVSVDRDTSTNDTVTILANGLAGNHEIQGPGPEYDAFIAALAAVTRRMSFLIASDGEGASHTIVCKVTGAPDKETARKISRSVISSNLFKAAVFGRDANWGRILCAIGYTDADFDVSRVDVTLSSDAGSVLVCQHAAHHPYSEEAAARILSEEVITVQADLHQGSGEATAWGCDLTYDYVKINGDYRT